MSLCAILILTQAHACISSGLGVICPETPSSNVFKYMTFDTINYHFHKLICDSCAAPSTQQSHTILVRPKTPSTHILKYMTSDTIEHHLGKLLYDSCAEPSIQQSHTIHNMQEIYLQQAITSIIHNFLELVPTLHWTSSWALQTSLHACGGWG